MKKVRNVVIWLLVLVVVGYTVVFYGIGDVQKAPLIESKIRWGQVLDATWTAILYAHIVGGVAALVLGPLALSNNLQKKRLNLHRILGKIYLLSVALGAVGGLYLAFHAWGGWISGLGFGLMSVAWVVTGWNAYRFARSGQIDDHRRWAIRNYAITFGAVTLRIMQPLSEAIVGWMHAVEAYQVIAWACWLVNLLVVEIYMKRRPTASSVAEREVPLS